MSKKTTLHVARGAANHPYVRTTSQPDKYTADATVPTRKSPVGPTNHMLVPQEDIFVQPKTYDRKSDRIIEPIEFQALGFHELGIRPVQILKEPPEPVSDGEAKVFENIMFREIRVRVLVRLNIPFRLSP